MKTRIALIFTVFMAFMCLTYPIQAQNRSAKSQQTQQSVDEQLAWQMYSVKEYAQARDLYRKLFQTYNRFNHFNLYIECLLQLKEYDEAEKALRDYVKKNPHVQKASVDLCYVYTMQGESNRAKKCFDKLLNELSHDKNSVQNLGNMLLGRAMYDFALQVYQKGAAEIVNGPAFESEIAYTYQAMGNYEQAFEHYFLLIDANPKQYDMVKNRLHQLLFFDVNNSITDQLRMSLLKKVQQNPDKEIFAELLVWFSLQTEDYETAMDYCISLDRRVGNYDLQILNLADVSRQNKQYAVAARGYQYISDLGHNSMVYIEASIGLLETEYEKAKAEQVTDIAFFESLDKKIDAVLHDLGVNKSVRRLLMLKADIMAIQLAKTDEAIALLQTVMNMPLSEAEKASTKMNLADIYLFKGEVWEATLLYSQVDKSMREEPLGHEARFRNARLRYYIGEFEWAQAQLKVLKSATSKLVANDAMALSMLIKDNLEYDSTAQGLRILSQADLNIYQHRYLQARLLLDTLINQHSNEIITPYALLRLSELAIRDDDFVMADSIYMQIIKQYPDSYIADEALMKCGMLRQNTLNNQEGAIWCFEQLMDNYPASINVATARKQYRILKRKTE